jgi:type I restriction enzyme R subunit
MLEADVENAALQWFEALGWRTIHGSDTAPGEPGAERASYATVFLEDRLREALRRLNPSLPVDALQEAFRKLTRITPTSRSSPTSSSPRCAERRTRTSPSSSSASS